MTTSEFLRPDFMQAVVDRHSTRSFTGQPFTADDIRNIDAAVAEANARSDGRFKIVFFPGTVAEGRVGTYGVISRPSGWFGVCAPEGTDAIRAAMAMERIVLMLTAAGIGTCWVGGTFDRKVTDTFTSQGAGMHLRVLVAAGYPAEKVRFVDRLMRGIAGSRKRKAVQELFTVVDGNMKYWRSALDAMRLAPSSMNSQPWRGRIYADRIEFSCATHSALSDIDMGIGLAHFLIGAEADGIVGRFNLTPAPVFALGLATDKYFV